MIYVGALLLQPTYTTATSRSPSPCSLSPPPLPHPQEIFHNALQILHSIHLCNDKALRKSNSTKLFSELTLHWHTLTVSTFSHTHTHHLLYKLVREQITCILSVIPRTLPAALHRSPFEAQPCDFSLSFLPCRPLCLLQGIQELNFKTMYGCCLRLSARAQAACKSEQDHTHYIGGLHLKAGLIANWVSRCEAHTANEQQECGCFKASG